MDIVTIFSTIGIFTSLNYCAFPAFVAIVATSITAAAAGAAATSAVGRAVDCAAARAAARAATRAAIYLIQLLFSSKQTQ